MLSSLCCCNNQLFWEGFLQDFGMCLWGFAHSAAEAVVKTGTDQSQGSVQASRVLPLQPHEPVPNGHYIVHSGIVMPEQVWAF